MLAFPEEQYNVNRLHHFLLNTVDALADAMERLKDDRMLAYAEKYVEAVGKATPEEIEEQVPPFLAQIGQQLQKSFLLLVDNADRLFETIEDRQQWRLRELRSARPDLTLFGATTQASDGIYGPERAFFEFFKIHRLVPLTLAEVRDLLLRLSESVEEKEGEKGTAKRRVEEWLAADAARLRTLVQLTGGNPRTTVLLFHLVLDGLTGGAREYLEQLLDQVTPTYKGRGDELPAQAQQVLDAVSLRWDPVTAMEVAEDTGLETSAVSSQLTRLARQGILEKADPGDSKKALYQVAERFFNIWYLMRASRRVRAKLRWFVEFLRVFFESGELEEMAWDRVERYRGTWRGHPEEIETAFAYVLASGARRDRVEDYLRQKCADSEEMWRPYLDLIECSVGDGKLAGAPGEAKSRTGEDSAVNTEADLRQAIEAQPENGGHWSRLGRLLAQKPERAVEAEAAYRKAIDLDPKLAGCWYNLGYLLAKAPERTADAEAAYRKAIELDPTTAVYWNSLGRLLAETPERMTEAEAAHSKAIEIEPASARFWHCLGHVLAETPERIAEAEAAYRRAIELDPKAATQWGCFGVFLACRAGRPGDAEVALRSSVQFGPDDFRGVRNLGVLLYCELAKPKEAAGYLRRAHQLDPKDSVSAAILAAALREAETAHEPLTISIEATRGTDFWNELLDLCQNYPPFGKILLGICDLVQERDPSNHFVALYRAVALAQLGDFPRASVALEDALTGDPIDLLSIGQRALETFLAAAVKNGRVRDCLQAIDKKDWKDAWRPIYEALRAVEEDSAEYLKRVAVEIRGPALVILHPAPATPLARSNHLNHASRSTA
ncbi:MAG: tetratricopeptide repeat protein [Candidatus Solibacter sp.]|nr:tetratricopeptide repeat protein [Candidatus Solibacter sp.]